jgi:hypothetical protein
MLKRKLCNKPGSLQAAEAPPVRQKWLITHTGYASGMRMVLSIMHLLFWSGT